MCHGTHAFHAEDRRNDDAESDHHPHERDSRNILLSFHNSVLSLPVIFVVFWIRHLPCKIKEARVRRHTLLQKRLFQNGSAMLPHTKKNLRSMLKSILSTRNTGSHRDPLHILRQGAPPFAGPKDNL